MGAVAHCVVPSLALQTRQLVLQSHKQSFVTGIAVFHIFCTPAMSHTNTGQAHHLHVLQWPIYIYLNLKETLGSDVYFFSILTGIF